ncbi:MAG: hypothetical protein L6Q66_00480 [Bacteroidia bacterium]|nr:hypothetical protein [Bacteroidia bacterium]
MIKLIEKYGFFRLTLIPLGSVIIISAFINGIWGMGLVGGIVLVFGILNKCLLLGQCEIDEKSSKSIKGNNTNN